MSNNFYSYLNRMSSAGERTALLKYKCLAADKWSLYPATQDVDMGCHSIKNLQSETFCDGTYIGPGASFDISSGETIIIKSTQNTEIQHYDVTATTIETRMRVEDAGKVSIKESAGQNATLRLENSNGDGGEISVSQTGGFMAVQAQAGYNLTMESDGGDINIATTTPDTTLALSVNGATAALTLIDTASVGSVNVNAGAGEILLATNNNNLTLNGTSGDTTWGAGGLATLNIGGGIALNTPNFSADINGNGYAAIGDLLGNNNFTRMIISDSAGTIDLFAPNGNVTVTANADININSTAGSGFLTVASSATIGTQSGTCGYTFDDRLRYNNSDTQLVDTNKSEQVPTNQVAVPQFQPRSSIPPNTINTTNPPAAAFYVTPSFIWRYSGNAMGQSAYCYTERIEADIDITVIGNLDDTIQWGVVMVDTVTTNRYYSVGAFRSFDNTDPATGLEYTTRGFKTNPTGDYNHTASIRCMFDGVNSIIDGNNVEFQIYAISAAGVLTVDEGFISYRVRPITRVP